MSRSRIFFAPLLAASLVAIPALAAAATLTVTGSSSGTATAEPPTAEASCDPPGATVPADFICDFVIAGTFDVTELGAGTYTGETRLDWSIYTGSEPCAELTGTMTLTNASGTITLEMLDTSRVCETADPMEHASAMDAVVAGGTGAYAGATGTVTGDGTLSATATAGLYDAAQSLAGTVTVPDPTPDPTPAPSEPDDVAPSATATPTDDLLPDTASGSDRTPATLVVLIGLVTVSAAVRLVGVRSHA